MQKNWHVLYVASRTEKKVAERLTSKGVEVYCPVRKEKRMWSDRVKVVETPLFTSYLFVYIEEAEKEVALQTPGVVRMLFWLNKPALVRQEEIDAIRYFLNEFEHESITISTFTPEDRIRFKSGPLMDMDAIVKDSDHKKMKVNLCSLDCVVEVDLRNTLVVKA